MSALAERGGRVTVRVGGNTQDYATLVPSLADGKIIEKIDTGNTNPVSTLLCFEGCWADARDGLQTETPTLDFTPDVIYMLGNISALVNVHWYLGESPLPCARAHARDGRSFPLSWPASRTTRLKMEPI